MSTAAPPRRAPGVRSPWASASVRLSIALAFADASVAVLALPQIVIRLHTTISHVTWVITAYNIALILSTMAVLPFAGRLASRRALVAGLALFGLASLGSGAADSLTILIVWRCLQGAGGALLLCASLPLFGRAAGANSEGGASLRAWAAAAAFGAGIGPAAGGLLTQVFDWRAIFFAQAPVALAAALFALAGPLSAEPVASAEATAEATLGAEPSPGPDARLSPAHANLALGLISAGLIGALFLSTVLLINVWQLTPLGAALVLAVIPLATVITERAVARRPAPTVGAAGALVLAVGLVGLALLSHRLLAPAIIALALSGIGLGLAFPALTRVALRTRGLPVARAARTVAAREGGLVLGLVLLTPLLVSQLNQAQARATPPITRAVLLAPISLPAKFQLGAGLLTAEARTPASKLPDLGPAFARVAVGLAPSERRALAQLKLQVQALVERAVTRSFRIPLLLCAGLSLLAIPALGVSRLSAGRRPRP